MRNGSNGRPCDFLVKEIRCFARQPPFLKIDELFDQVLVFGKFFFEQAGIEDEPFVNIGCHKVLDLKVFMGNPFAQIVQNKFMKGLDVDIVHLEHFCLVGRFFCFDNDSNRSGSTIRVVDYKIVPAFGVDVMVWPVIGVSKKFGYDIFMELL